MNIKVLWSRIRVAYLVLFKGIKITSARENYLLEEIEDMKEHIRMLEKWHKRQIGE